MAVVLDFPDTPDARRREWDAGAGEKDSRAKNLFRKRIFHLICGVLDREAQHQCRTVPGKQRDG